MNRLFYALVVSVAMLATPLQAQTPPISPWIDEALQRVDELQENPQSQADALIDGAMLAAYNAATDLDDEEELEPIGIPETKTPGDQSEETRFPFRGAFYYGWYPENWGASCPSGDPANSNFNPVAGCYNSADASTMTRQIDELFYANVDVGIASWRRDTERDARFGALLEASLNKDLLWSLFYEEESISDPTWQTIRLDLSAISRPNRSFTSHQNYLRLCGGTPNICRPTIFVHFDADDGCDRVLAWRDAIRQTSRRGSIPIPDFYIIFQVFPGFGSCSIYPSQPHDFIQWAPAQAVSNVGDGYSISPGYFPYNGTQTFRSTDAEWRQNIRNMIGEGDPWQLVTTYNQWPNGSMVEPATNFDPDNLYLQALHENGQEEFVLMGAGDISCAKYKEDGTLNSNWNGGLGTGQNCRQKYTADLMTAVSPDRVLTFGDVQYEQGEYLNFQESYALSWGQPALKSITSPTLGNHDYDDPNPSIFPQFTCVRTDEQNECANGYFDFFNGVDDSPEAPAGQRDKGYYSYRLGGEWLILALNSELCGSPQTGTGCNDGTPQYEFVQQTLADNADAACTLAYWHHPRFSHGSDHGDQANLAQLYTLLYQNNVDLVIVGHSHSYQRFAQLDPDGNADTTVADGDPIGIRYIIVGTGGRNHTGVLTDTALTAAGRTPHPLQASSPPATDTGTTGTGAFGVIKLSLTSTGFSWDFESTTTAQYSGANEYTDASSDTCH